MRFRHVITTAAVVALYACGTMREDEQYCEEAVSRLVGCCPGFDLTQISCQYSEGCTGSNDQFPALTIEESECIRDRSCDQLRAGICARAQMARRGDTASKVCQ